MESSPAMMLLHAFWLPAAGDAFIQSGELRLWVERESPILDQRVAAGVHPFQPTASEWPVLLEGLGLQRKTAPAPRPIACEIRLPSIGGVPLPSPELAQRLPELPDTDGATLETWQVDTIPLRAPIRQLAEIQFLALHQGDALALGQDLRFWAWPTQGPKRLVLRDQYLPAQRLHQPPQRKGSPFS
jgi:hypothetical protein